MGTIQKETTKKTYVLILSRFFPATHPRKGEPTGFEHSYLAARANAINDCPTDGFKIHTIRHNYPLWKKRIDEINAGNAVLSIRCWQNKPYRSKQIEIDRLEKVGIENCTLFQIFKGTIGWDFRINGIRNPKFDVPFIAENDGLDVVDFMYWFFPKPKDYKIEAAVIHFTDFRYSVTQ